MKQYKARYDGVQCYRCNKPINKEDYITWSKKPPKRMYHVNCESPQVWPNTEETPTPQTVACQYCGKPGFTNPIELRNHILTDCPKSPVPKSPIPTPSPEPIPSPIPQNQDEVFEMKIPPEENDTPNFDSKPAKISSNDGLLTLIAEQVESKVIDNVRAKVDASIGRIDKLVKEKLDKLTIPSIEIIRHELPKLQLNNVHKQFKDVLQLLNSGEYVYLHGSPGGHKSSIGPQLAEALGVRYGYMSLCEQTPEYVVKGFTSPIDGKYYGSMFTDFYENGGLFCWEEMDAANDNLRSSLNTMLENKKAALDKGLVSMHEKFYMVANGNTCGRGAHPAFPSRTAFDAAFAARFIFLEFEYDWELAKHISVGLNKQSAPIVEWAEKVANWALANGVQLVMSPREVYKLAKLMVTTDLSHTILLDGVLHGLDVASKEKLLTNYPFPQISRG